MARVSRRKREHGNGNENGNGRDQIFSTETLTGIVSTVNRIKRRRRININGTFWMAACHIIFIHWR